MCFFTHQLKRFYINVLFPVVCKQPNREIQWSRDIFQNETKRSVKLENTVNLLSKTGWIQLFSMLAESLWSSLHMISGKRKSDSANTFKSLFQRRYDGNDGGSSISCVTHVTLGFHGVFPISFSETIAGVRTTQSTWTQGKRLQVFLSFVMVLN